jgi:hypothetical protein
METNPNQDAMTFSLMMMTIMIEMDPTGLLKKCLEFTMLRHFKMSSCTLSKIVTRESCTIASTTTTGLIMRTTKQYVAFFQS